MADQDEDFVEVFRTTHQAAAEWVVDEVLTPAGIPAAIHNRTSSFSPAPDAMPGGYFIAVASSRAAQALDALREAEDAGVLPDTGEIANA